VRPVGGCAEAVAHDDFEHADQHGDEHQPGDQLASTPNATIEQPVAGLGRAGVEVIVR
jgi:hypothetical protein